jgi:hypothetical protein
VHRARCRSQVPRQPGATGRGLECPSHVTSPEHRVRSARGAVVHTDLKRRLDMRWHWWFLSHRDLTRHRGASAIASTPAAELCVRTVLFLSCTSLSFSPGLWCTRSTLKMKIPARYANAMELEIHRPRTLSGARRCDARPWRASISAAPSALLGASLGSSPSEKSSMTLESRYRCGLAFPRPRVLLA